jgi:hypothetical protein
MLSASGDCVNQTRRRVTAYDRPGRSEADRGKRPEAKSAAPCRRRTQPADVDGLRLLRYRLCAPCAHAVDTFLGCGPATFKNGRETTRGLSPRNAEVVLRPLPTKATRPGLEPGTREPKSLVLPITPPGSKCRPGCTKPPEAISVDGQGHGDPYFYFLTPVSARGTSRFCGGFSEGPRARGPLGIASLGYRL